MLDFSKDKVALRNFGLLMGAVFSIVAAVLFYKVKMKACAVFGGVALIFILVALVFPGGLSGIYIRWMKFANVIGRFNTKVILSLMYASVFTTIRILLFLFRKDPLEKKFDSSLDSYWSDHEPVPNDPKRYEKQF